MYGLQVLAELVYLLEKLLGFGKTRKDEQGGVVKAHVKNEDQYISEVMFRNMSFYTAIFSALLFVVKLGILLLGRMIVDPENVLKCNVDND